MREVTRYEARDGTIWESEEEARERDDLVEECEKKERELGLDWRPEGTDFLNGHGYIQLEAGTREQLSGWLKSKGVHRDTRGPLGRLLHTLHCIDEKDRRWGQPYFALHPDRSPEPVEVPRA